MPFSGAILYILPYKLESLAFVSNGMRVSVKLISPATITPPWGYDVFNIATHAHGTPVVRILFDVSDLLPL